MKLTFKLLPFLLIITVSCTKDIKIADSPGLLWFDRPAEVWEEATPLGNGRIGAMDFGQTVQQIIQLNEESLWAGEPEHNLPENAQVHIQKFTEIQRDATE